MGKPLLKNITYTEPFESLWRGEIESRLLFSNRLFCITFIICNPASAISYYLAQDPYFYVLLPVHTISGSFLLILLFLNYKGRISGQHMTLAAYVLLICFYAYLLAQPRESYTRSCINLTLVVIFAGLVLRWPVRYALLCAVLAIVLYPLAIYVGNKEQLSIFFEDGGVFLLISYVIFPIITRTGYLRAKSEFFYRYSLQQQNEALEAQKVIAENATRAKSDFLSMMSHEIRTPLNGIVGIVHIMMQEESRQGAASELLQTLKFSSDHLMAVVNDVLDFNKINSNYVVLDPQPFDPLLLFENLRKTFVPKTEEKGLKLIFDIDPQLPPQVVADKVRLNQVLTNLIHNAVKFTYAGYVRFVVKELSRNDQFIQLHFEVIDTGIGIAADQQPVIFEIFTQAKAAVPREHEGTGLGLAISKELLHLFGSEIELKSEVGKGSVFSFQLVMGYSRKRLESEVYQDETLGAISYPQARVLVVDDNKTNLMFATMLLKRRNILYDTANNGQEAFEMFTQYAYNLILMDLRMPVMDGFESTRLIRETNAEIPVIALTASAFEDEKERAMANGFTGYLIKPFIPEDFYNYIYPFLGIPTSEEK